VQTCAGTPTLSSGTADARAALGAVQDDQMQGHEHQTGTESAFNTLGSTHDVYVNTGTTLSSRKSSTLTIIANTTDGTPRTGHNTREATYSVPVPMVVTLVPYGVLTL